MLSAIALSNLTFSLPLSKTNNNISIDLSSYDTITARNTALSSYLPLSGGSISGTLNLSGNNLTFPNIITKISQ